MAESKKPADAAANGKLPEGGGHDRVSMLSLRADGTPDQHDPEIIGDKDVAIAAAKEQFAQQAVSAADVAGVGGGSVAEGAPQDPSIAEAEAEHKEVAAAAEKRAEATVEQLHKG